MTTDAQQRYADESAAHSVSLREVLTSCFKQAPVIAAVFVLVAGAATAVSFLPTPKYIAEATLLVKLGHEYMMRPDLESQALPAISTERIVTSEVDILRSPGLVRATVERIGLATLYPELIPDEAQQHWLASAIAAWGLAERLDPIGLGDSLRDLAAVRPPRIPPEEAAAEKFTRSLSITPGRESNTIFLSFQHPDRAVAEQALGTLIRIHLDRRSTLFSDARAAFVQTEADKVRARLEDLDRRIAAFKQGAGIVQFEQQRDALIEQESLLITERHAAQNALAEAASRVEKLRAALAGVAPTIRLYAERETSRSVDDARSALQALQVRERSLLARFTENSAPVQDVRQRLAAAEAVLRQAEQVDNRAVRDGANPLYEQVQFDLIRAESELQAQKARLEAVAAQTEALTGRLQTLDSHGDQLAQLERERAVASESYQIFARQVDETTVRDEMERQSQTNVALVQPPITNPRMRNLQPMILAGGLFLALFAAIGVGLVREFLRSNFLTPEKLERTLGIPVLAAIPDMTRRKV